MFPSGQTAPDPDLSDLSALTEAATRAESLLLEWMSNRAADQFPPPIKDITAATQALWRLTAVRKTLLGLERRDSDHFDPDPWSKQSTELTDEEIECLINREDEGLDPTEVVHEEPSLVEGPASDATEPLPTQLLNLQAPTAPGARGVPSCPTIPAASIRGVTSPPAHVGALVPPPSAPPSPSGARTAITLPLPNPQAPSAPHAPALAPAPPPNSNLDPSIHERPIDQPDPTNSSPTPSSATGPDRPPP